jgi:UDPglucose--hexose-1-phosphate uridylyltransferase
MPELRKDPVVGRWVIIATERGKRPGDFVSQPIDVPEQARNPFAEGNEHMTPPEIFAFRDPKSKANASGWQVRVVPNKFPVLRIEGELDKEGQGMYDKMNGIGAHEVIIETPNPSLQLEQQTIEGIGRVIETYKIRVTDLLRDPRFRYILVFKNFGKQAGATIGHPHSQLIAMPVTPKRMKEKLVGAMQYYAYKDRSLFEDILKQEIKDGSRLVYENAGFVSFCPFASRRQSAYFQDIHPDEILLLADCLKVTLMKLSKALNQPQYNLLISNGPARYAHHGYWSTIDQDFRWHIEILPRLTLIAGFEVGTGFYINPTPPEEAAKYLREILV